MEIFLITVVAAGITAISVPLTIKLAHKYGLVDNPNQRLHPAHAHQRIIPRAGGLPIYLGIIVSSLIFLPMEKHLIGITLGISLLLLVGLLDDKFLKFNPYLRLVLMFIAAAFAVISGIGVTFISNPVYQFANPLFDFQSQVIRLDSIILPIKLYGVHKIVLIADLLAFFWIVALTQIINWAKGVDGQMPGITAVAALVLGIFSYNLYLQGDPNQLNLSKLAFITTGVSIGFLIFNWYPSKILPAFSGSTILAFMLAALSILAGAKLATALLVLAIPTIDFVYTFFRRIFQGHSPVWADRGHLHHRLLDLGWSHQRISLFYIIGSAILGTIALLVDTGSKLFVILAVAMGFCLLILWLNSFSIKTQKRLR